jgi:hypothetical protein
MRREWRVGRTRDFNFSLVGKKTVRWEILNSILACISSFYYDTNLNTLYYLLWLINFTENFVYKNYVLKFHFSRWICKTLKLFHISLCCRIFNNFLFTSMLQSVSNVTYMLSEVFTLRFNIAFHSWIYLILSYIWRHGYRGGLAYINGKTKIHRKRELRYIDKRKVSIQTEGRTYIW